MGTNVTIKRKIVVNGVEYHSVDELPPEVRAAYDKALTGRTKQRVTVNGQDFDSLDAVPHELRALIEDAAAPRRASSKVPLLAVLAGLVLLIVLALLRLR